MPRVPMQLAIGAQFLACLGLLALAPVARAGCQAEDGAAAAVESTPALTEALWRLAGGAAAVAPHDPATFIGPPVPLAILYAPAAPVTSAGLRVELEVAGTPAGPPAPAPGSEPITRWSDVYSRLVPVRHADGSLSIDLSGITLVDLHAWRDARGVHLAEGDAPDANGGGDR